MLHEAHQQGLLSVSAIKEGSDPAEQRDASLGQTPNSWRINVKRKNASGLEIDEMVLLNEARKVMSQVSPKELARVVQRITGTRFTEDEFTGQMDIEYHDKG